jgi:hypothetical protein
MEAIIVRCKMCKHTMKFSPQKAGKRAKCPKCDTIVLIQAEEEVQKKEASPTPELAPEAPPAPKPATNDEEEDAEGAYGVFLDPEIEERQKKLREAEEAKGKKKDRKKLPKVGRKIKAIPDARSWNFVRLGMLFIFIGTWIWLACHIMQGTYVILGVVEFPEYAHLIGRNLEMRNDEGFPEIGRGWDLDWVEVYLGMIVGRDFASYARFCLTLSSFLFYVQALLWAAGYLCCLPVPRRFGMFGQIIAAGVFSVINTIFNFFLKFLPVIGVHGYVLIPFLFPEISMTEYNMERMVPIHVLWSGAPFWESVFNLILKFMVYLEPAFVSMFIWSAGIAIKDENIEQGGKGRTQMALGTYFIMVVFHLMSLTGASPVMVMVMRVVYTLWYFFVVIFLLQYAMLIMKFRAVLYDKIHPRFELEEEEKVDDEEEDDEDDEDDEDEDDDEEEDEEEEDRPRKKRAKS